MAYRRIIIVGENNVSVSFMCEVILRGLLKKKNVTEIDIISRGLVVLFSEPVAPLAITVLEKYGYVIEDFRSSQLTEKDMDEADLILALTDDLASRVHESYPSSTTVMSLGVFLDLDASIPDISGGSLEDYEKCFLILEQLMEAVADRIAGELTL